MMMLLYLENKSFAFDSTCFQKNEILKDPAFLTTPIFSPIILTKRSLSNQRDDHRIPMTVLHLSLSHSSILTSSQKATHRYTYITFVEHTKPQKYFFVNS